MADGVVGLAADGTGKKVDTSELTVGTNTVERQRINISDPTSAAAIVAVTNTTLTGAEYGAVTRPIISGSDGTTPRVIKTATDGTLLINGVQDSRTAGTITTASSVVNASVVNRNVLTFSFSGTYAGVTVNLEATDDGTNWYGLQSINNATGQAGFVWALATNSTQSFDAAIGGYITVRARASAYTSGTCNVGINPQVFAYEPVVAAITQGISASGTAIAGAPILNGGTFTTTLPTVTTGQAVNMQTTNRGEQLVAISNGAIAATIKGPAITAVAGDSSLVVSFHPSTGLPPGVNTIGIANTATPTSYAVTSTATTNAAFIKASAGTMFQVTASNTGAAVAFVKLYNQTATPTVGTSVPILTIAVPPSGVATLNLGTLGYRFLTGIAIAITNLGADTDATAVAASQVKVIASYV
jgi:hypothetical protein